MPTECFFCRILSASYLTHRMLFSDVAPEALERAGAAGSNIYYLTRTKRIRFCPNTASISPAGILSFSVANISDGPPHQFQLPLEALYPFSTADLRSHEFAEMYSPVASISAVDTTRIEFTLNYEDKPFEVLVPIENIVSATDHNFGTRPEIVYIGQTSDLLRRWKTHKQINHAASLLADDEELRLYHLHFEYGASYAIRGDARWNAFLDVSDRESQSYLDRVSLLEQALIQFYRPILNTQHVDGTLNTQQFQRITAAVSLETMGLGLGVNGHAFAFWSEHQHLPDEAVTLRFNNGTAVFEPGVKSLWT